MATNIKDGVSDLIDSVNQEADNEAQEIEEVTDKFNDEI